MLPSQTRETAFNKDERKHGQREILERHNIRQVPNKRRVQVQSQNRDLLIRDVCTCLAPGIPSAVGGPLLPLEDSPLPLPSPWVP